MFFFSDCIGSAFNVSGVMQCPNCREIEHGVWRRFENNTEENGDEESDEEDERNHDHMVKARVFFIYIYYSVPVFFYVAYSF